MMLSPELKYLSELIRDFLVANGIEAAEEAEELIASSYEFLLESYQLKEFPESFKLLAREFHLKMYQNILSNAGEYRQPHDKNGGVVIFGIQRTAESPYRGSPAGQIEQDLDQAFQFLQKNDPNPIKNAVTFYQKFVRIHPFYDANGRIGKLLVSHYLNYYNYHINWHGLEQHKNKWFKKLNACHDRQNRESLYREYLGYLADYFNDYVLPKNDLEII